MSPQVGAELLLYGRRYCHLCEEMEALVAPVAAEFGLAIRYVDIDSAPELEARYGARIPVLALGEAEIAQFRADPAVVREVLAQIR
ncbi:MAG: glutaredoxin family protein [Burkholderiales bacterium]|jgi:thiol-disulfide isomerase/thioredoxin|nr:glutaredoxin family protein [Burkholderiales bacterium]